MSFLSFKANAKTGIAGVRHLNVWVTALDIMFHGWLETVRNPAISVIQRRNERSETIKNKKEKETFF